MNAEERIPSEAENHFINWVNAARENPLLMAKSIGLNVNEVVADLPELREILFDGLKPIRFDARLFQAASRHAEDMIQNSFYSSESPSGETISDRLFAEGYFPMIAEESLGMIGFTNFMQSAEAAWIIFEDLFKKELSPTVDKRVILNPEVQDAAVALQSGSFIIEQKPINIYVAVCDFANDSTSTVEFALHEWINGFRAFPIQTLEKNATASISPDLANDTAGSSATDGVSALEWSFPVSVAGEMHIADMTERVYFSHLSPEGDGPAERLHAQDIDATYVLETLGVVLLQNGFIHPMEAGLLLYSEILGNEAGKMGMAIPNSLLYPNAQKMGISFRGVNFNLDDGSRLPAYAMVLTIVSNTSIFSPVMLEEYHDEFVIIPDYESDKF